MQVRQIERHRAGRTGWLRAAVLGANDGLLSTASLVLGVAAAHGSRSNVLIAGFAALVAGAMSVAVGEYVSVHSQKDTEDADLALERTELRTNDKGERQELAEIYVNRGLDPELAKKVADQLMTRDALGAHARDELGITPTLEARPMQAALASDSHDTSNGMAENPRSSISTSGGNGSAPCLQRLISVVAESSADDAGR